MGSYVEVYLNRETESPREWLPTDRMRVAFRGKLEVESEPQAAKQALDQEESGYSDRPLRQGDIITLEANRSYSITSNGFKPVSCRTGHPA